MKVTSRRLAKIAGKVVAADRITGAVYWDHGKARIVSGTDIKAAFASLLSQTEKPTLRDAVKATKRLRAKRKVKK